MNWFKKRVNVWSDFCLSFCLRSAIPSINYKIKELNPIESIDLAKVPSTYHDLFLANKKLCLYLNTDLMTVPLNSCPVLLYLPVYIIYLVLRKKL